MQRDALGMPDLAPVVIDHPLSTLTDAEIDRRADQAAAQCFLFAAFCRRPSAGRRVRRSRSQEIAANRRDPASLRKVRHNLHENAGRLYLCDKIFRAVSREVQLDL